MIVWLVLLEQDGKVGTGVLNRGWTRIFCVQVRSRPIRGGFDTLLGGVLTCYC